MIDFLFIIVRFPSISQNDRSIKSFVWKNRSFNQIVLSVQKSWFSQSLLSKQFFFSSSFERTIQKSFMKDQDRLNDLKLFDFVYLNKNYRFHISERSKSFVHIVCFNLNEIIVHEQFCSLNKNDFYLYQLSETIWPVLLILRGQNL